jgi:prepilin-type N-terminal cleavage/methylation domain-containing protein
MLRKRRGRRGFTLIELLISLVMLAIVGNAMLALVVTMRRITRKQSETATMQGSLRTAFQLLQTELVELSPEDLTELNADRVRYRAMRGLGEACERSPATIKVAKSSYSGLRAPTAGRDGVWVFVEGDSTRNSDDRWVPLALTAVSASSCPDGGEAWTLNVSLGDADSAKMVVPSPIRTYEEMEIGQVEEDGMQWLGIRSVGFGEASLVPVSGPVTWNGVRFVYLDGSDSSTPTPSLVRSMIVTLRGVTERPIGTNLAGLVRGSDSLQLRVRLRN